MSAPVEADPTHDRPDRFVAWADDRLTRVGLTGDFRRDCALAALVLLVSTGLLLVLFADSGQAVGLLFTPFQIAAVLVVTWAQALVLCIRRVRPVLCLCVMVLLQVALLAVLPSTDAVRGIAPVAAAYTCGVLLPVRRAARIVTGVAVFESAAFAVVHFAAGLSVGLVTGHLLASLLSYVGAAVLGTFVATRRQYVELVRLRAAEAVESQRARAAAAIGLERSRMARELHDIAAHHLSGMVVQSAVVERLIDRDPQAAKEAAAWIRGQGKETLRNLRLAVGALREPGPDALGDDEAPVPGIAVLDGLVRTVRELGTPVDLTREGVPRELPPIADVTFYRVTQEALSNARRHAPGAAVRVLLRFRAADVTLDVVNEAAPGPAAAPPDRRRGFGLVGMRERAQLIGGTFDAGPTSSGGWRVSLTLALDGETYDGGTVAS